MKRDKDAPPLDLPEKLDLARLPTPLERLDRVSEATGLDLWIKRDDLTGSALTGNKVRKLEYLAADAVARGADTLVTCGAVNSNHARATAVVAARLNMRSHLVLRGHPTYPPTGNLLLDRMLGAETTFITREQWAERDEIMEAIARQLGARRQAAYLIPEGGSNALGCLGYARAVEELLAQEAAQDLRIRRIVHATGSGGTTAGLALGVAAAGRDDIDVIGVAVCDDRAFFDERIGGILDAAVAAGYATKALRDRARWQIEEGYKGEGYGLTTPREMERIARVAREEGIFLDPVYTGKAFSALVGEFEAGRLDGEGQSVFLHTGGIFGLFQYGEEIAALDR